MSFFLSLCHIYPYIYFSIACLFYMNRGMKKKKKKKYCELHGNYTKIQTSKATRFRFCYNHVIWLDLSVLIIRRQSYWEILNEEPKWCIACVHAISISNVKKKTSEILLNAYTKRSISIWVCFFFLSNEVSRLLMKIQLNTAHFKNHFPHFQPQNGTLTNNIWD